MKISIVACLSFVGCPLAGAASAAIVTFDSLTERSAPPYVEQGVEFRFFTGGDIFGGFADALRAGPVWCAPIATPVVIDLQVSAAGHAVIISRVGSLRTAAPVSLSAVTRSNCACRLSQNEGDDPNQ